MLHFVPMDSENNLIREPIPKLIKQISVPVMIGFFFNTMFNVVDTYFGGKISTQALAALSLSFPVFFLIIIFDSGISTGTTAVIANALGAGEREKAKKYAAQSISFAFIVSIFVTIFGLIVSPSIFRLLGAKEAYLSLSLSFMNVIFYGSVFFLMISVMNSVLQATGNTKPYRNFLIAGFFLNIIFNPWFLYGGFGIPAMGLAGVALSTVAVEIIGTVYIFWTSLKTGLITKETWHLLWPEKEAYRDIAGQAVPASLNLATVGIGVFVITYFISHFGENAVASYGIATRIEQIALLPTIGFTIACLTIIGQNNGAGKLDRIRETLKRCLAYGLGVMAIGAVLIFAFSKPLMGFFTKDAVIVAMGSHYLIFAACTFLAYAILFISVSALQGMKKPLYAVWIGLFRQIAAPFVFFGLCIYTLHTNIDGIWWGIVLINWLAAIVTILYVRRVFKKKGI